MKSRTLSLLAVIGLVAFAIVARSAVRDLPKFEPDPYWPKHLPNNWILGQVSGVAVDAHDELSIDPARRMNMTNIFSTRLRTVARPLRQFWNSIKQEICFSRGADRVRVMNGRTRSTEFLSITKTTSGSLATARRTPTC